MLVAAAACDSSPTSSEPGADATRHTLLVADAACLLGPCGPVEVGGWPVNFALPCPSQGCAIPIDTIAGAFTCLRLPSVLLVFVHEVDQAGRVVHTDTLRWTPEDPIRLMLHRLGEPRAYTDPFVPDSAAGWHLAFVAGGPGTPIPSSVCVP
jgi:hypothetical protein